MKQGNMRELSLIQHISQSVATADTFEALSDKWSFEVGCHASCSKLELMTIAVQMSKKKGWQNPDGNQVHLKQYTKWIRISYQT